MKNGCKLGWMSTCALLVLSSTVQAQMPERGMRHNSRSDQRQPIRQRPYTQNIPATYGYQRMSSEDSRPMRVMPAAASTIALPAAPTIVDQPVAVPAPMPAPMPAPLYVPKVQPQPTQSMAPSVQQPPASGATGQWKKFVPTNMREVRNHPTLQGNLWGGYRVDDLDFNIAGNFGGANPNVISELTWRNLEMYEVGGNMNYTHPEGMLRNVYLDATLSYATTFAGRNQDSDFNADDRQGEFSRSYADSDDGQATSMKFAAGYAFDVSPSRAGNAGVVASNATQIFLTPMLGYARQTLDTTMTNGVLVIPEQITFDGLASSYDTRWDGPFAALKMAAYMGRHRFSGRGEYHIADFQAGAQWNLRTDFNQPLSWVQRGDAQGIELALDYSYMIYDHWGINAGFGLRDWSVEEGNTFFLLSDVGFVPAQRLNEVNWASYSYRLGMNYSF